MCRSTDLKRVYPVDESADAMLQPHSWPVEFLPEVLLGSAVFLVFIVYCPLSRFCCPKCYIGAKDELQHIAFKNIGHADQVV